MLTLDADPKGSAFLPSSVTQIESYPSRDEIERLEDLS